jgi:hypothetical protein
MAWKISNITVLLSGIALVLLVLGRSAVQHQAARWSAFCGGRPSTAGVARPLASATAMTVAAGLLGFNEHVLDYAR